MRKTILLDKLRPGWRERRKLRKSPWHAIKLILFAGVAIALWFWVLFPLIWQLHTYFHPEHVGQLSQFWNRSTDSIPERISAFLMIVPAGVILILVSMLVTNLLLYCVPPARRAFETEAESDQEISFITSMRGLLIILFWVAVVTIPMIVYGAATIATL